MMKKLLTVFLLSILSVGIIMGGIATSTPSYSKTSEAPLAATRVYIEPQNGTANIGEQYTITVKIGNPNVTNLYALDIQIRWGTAVLRYNSHTTYVGQPGGVLNLPVFPNIDEVNETSTFSKEGAVPGTTYWTSYLCIGSAIPFNGTGIVFTMTFDVLSDGECDIYFTKIALTNRLAAQIPFVQEDGYFYQTGLDQVPVADFTFFPDPAVANKTTTFDASSSYDPDTGGGISLYIWNFNDGTPITNTTSPTTTHNFTTVTPIGGYYPVDLTVLDDQGGGSQSKPKIVGVAVVHPRPVAQFTVWPEDRVAVVDKAVIFNASESYDPDPGGNITEYRWNFGDFNLTNTPSPIIIHKFNATSSGGYSVTLKVVDDSDGLESLQTEPQLVIVVQRRDIEVISVAASPAEVRQGEDVAIDVTIANKGEAEERFNITAYYNTTMTNWIKVDEKPVSDFPEQYVPELEFAYGTSLNSTVYHVLNDIDASDANRDDTKVRVGTDTGYWTLNPGLLNTAASSPTLVSGTPLTTGGWIWEKESFGPKKLNGEFAPGNWAFKFKLYATQAGVNATVWTRILKSDNPDPQAAGALITVIKDWTSVFTAKRITNTTAGALTVPDYNGNVSVPFTVFTDEYLFLELQLQVTENTSGSSTTNVVFQVGGTAPVRKSRIMGTMFSSRGKYTLSWITEFASAGNHVVKIETSEVPHETNLTNNMEYSNAVQVTQLSIEVPPLDVSLDVGTMHFRGEIAEFYILITSSGRRVDASLNASMLFNRMTTEIDPTDIEHVGIGIYSINYQIPADASTGTFALVVDASRLVPELNFTQTGSALKSFLVSPTFTYWDTVFAEWNATLLEIEDNIAVINTNVGEIRANLTAINATLSGLIIGAKDEVLAEIDTALGPVITTLETINATVTTIQGDTATISSSLGDANTSIGALQSTITMGLVATSILSAIAAIVAVLILLRIRKLGK